MPYAFPPDVKRLVESEMASGKYATEDDLLRDALDALSSESTEIEAIESAIAEWRAGDPGAPLADAFDDVRRRNQASAG